MRVVDRVEATPRDVVRVPVADDRVVVRVVPNALREERSPVRAPRVGLVPVANPLDVVAEAARPDVATVRVPRSSPRVLDPRTPTPPFRSRPPRVPRVRLVSALRAMVSPRGA